MRFDKVFARPPGMGQRLGVALVGETLIEEWRAQMGILTMEAFALLAPFPPQFLQGFLKEKESAKMLIAEKLCF